MGPPRLSLPPEKQNTLKKPSVTSFWFANVVFTMLLENLIPTDATECIPALEKFHVKCQHGQLDSMLGISVSKLSQFLQ